MYTLLFSFSTGSVNVIGIGILLGFKQESIKEPRHLLRHLSWRLLVSKDCQNDRFIISLCIAEIVIQGDKSSEIHKYEVFLRMKKR